MHMAARAAAWVAWAVWTCNTPHQGIRSKESGLRSALFLRARLVSGQLCHNRCDGLVGRTIPGFRRRTDPPGARSGVGVARYRGATGHGFRLRAGKFHGSAGGAISRCCATRHRQFPRHDRECSAASATGAILAGQHRRMDGRRSVRRDIGECRFALGSESRHAAAGTRRKAGHGRRPRGSNAGQPRCACASSDA